MGNWVRVSQIYPAILPPTTCLARHSMPLKSLVDAYKSPSTSPTFVMQTHALPSNVSITGRWLNLRLEAVFLTVLSLVHHPLRLDSRRPGICSGPYDDVLRTTCGGNELLMRCREGSYAREGS
ncbi:hypothetical protein K443DRAFT_116777 [Laccaria amethystina LaAM-08-1]|uniref:Uncharacterized protein n=1 Tax=Laccaria amethystina LaAM-08-1 TaxID=1095629 RepID=A0A0C9X162_9AGAR|nr:hypothetical protein K443DRAFT_116777 [Laccaria amethystina LaAM-08-1]